MMFGGRGAFAKVGSTGLDDARRQIDLCLEAGGNFFDTADIYSDGLSEEILGQEKYRGKLSAKGARKSF